MATPATKAHEKLQWLNPASGEVFAKLERASEDEGQPAVLRQADWGTAIRNLDFSEWFA